MRTRRPLREESDHMNKKFQNIAVFTEFLAGSGLAIFFHVVLNNSQAAYTIFGIGLLLSLATYLIRQDVEQTREILFDQYNQAHEITFAIAHINDPDCQTKAHEIMASTKRTLSLLQQGCMPLDETEFYLEVTRCSDQTSRTIRTVDHLMTEWITRGSLVNLYQVNLRSLERGTKITRIFVTEPDELTNQDIQSILYGQFQDGVDIRIAYRKDLPASSDIGGFEGNCSFNFSIHDDHIVTDVISQSSKYFGMKTREPALVGKYLHLFDLIEHVAHTVVLENGKIVPSIKITSIKQ
jgi:hypothetical protein